MSIAQEWFRGKGLEVEFPGIAALLGEERQGVTRCVGVRQDARVAVFRVEFIRRVDTGRGARARDDRRTTHGTKLGPDPKAEGPPIPCSVARKAGESRTTPPTVPATRVVFTCQRPAFVARAGHTVGWCPL